MTKNQQKWFEIGFAFQKKFLETKATQKYPIEIFAKDSEEREWFWKGVFSCCNTFNNFKLDIKSKKS